MGAARFANLRTLACGAATAEAEETPNANDNELPAALERARRLARIAAKHLHGAVGMFPYIDDADPRARGANA
jgi:hypothetical protein